MHGRHRKQSPLTLAFRWAVVFVLAVALSISSFATVMANTVTAVVVDGELSYTFNMNSTDLREILSQAEEQGLRPLGPLDMAERVENTTTVNVRRGVSVNVSDGGRTFSVLAYRGDTVGKALEDNNIILTSEDKVSPADDTPVSAGMLVEISRSCIVTVNADGQRSQFTVAGGGTVADALAQAGVTLGGKDIANYGMGEPLFNNMIIRVSRNVTITVTADGETGEYEVAAETVRAALEKCGVALSDEDRLNVSRLDKPEDGMKIEITRVTVEEVVETEEVEYGSDITYSDEMYDYQSEVTSPGENGEKEVTYRLVYVEGELESKTAVSEKVTREPVNEKKTVGTLKNYNPFYYDGPGTTTDCNGEVFSYSQVLYGPCTAYYPTYEGAHTSIGLLAEEGVIAVDPLLIPYGTMLYVTSADGSVVYGYGVAGDTGGAAMDRIIVADLCYNTKGECSKIGRRNMLVYVLN